jgi:hypothetical protein
VQQEQPCNLGKPISERAVLRPKLKTFYSIDTLNPDVIRWRGRYWMFFSGNSSHTPGGDWKTGVAVADSPLGPFHVLAKMAAPFLNGSTRAFGNSLVQIATPPGFGQPVLYRSSNLGTWKARSTMPAGFAWNAYESDAYYDVSGLVYFAGRPGPGGADIGSRRYLGGNRWGEAKLELGRGQPSSWDALDLGEPSVFRIGKRLFMLYGGLGIDGGSRQIGLARKASTGWQRCASVPLIRAGGAAWHSKNAIDPEPLVVGNRLYVYFGGGKTVSLGGDMDGTIGVRVYRTTAIANKDV